MNLKDLTRYRTPLLLGIGGIVAFSAYQRTRQGAQAAAEAVAAGPGAAAPAGLSPEAALAAQAAAYQAGGGLGLQGAQLGLQTAQGGLDLAGIATMGAQALAGDVVGLASSLGNTLGQVASDVTATLPSFAPAAGIQPQPTQPAPAPAPAPTPATVTVLTRTPEYRVHTGTGVRTLFSVSAAKLITGSRQVTFANSSAPVNRMGGAGILHWRTAAGPLAGWSWIPSRSGSFSISRRYREALSNGTVRFTEYVTIGNTGS